MAGLFYNKKEQPVWLNGKAQFRTFDYGTIPMQRVILLDSWLLRTEGGL